MGGIGLSQVFGKVDVLHFTRVHHVRTRHFECLMCFALLSTRKLSCLYDCTQFAYNVVWCVVEHHWNCLHTGTRATHCCFHVLPRAHEYTVIAHIYGFWFTLCSVS